MADYSPPTLEDLWAAVARDLVDPEHKVWSTDQLTDYINGGIGELNRVNPLETSETLVWDADTETLPLGPLTLEHPFHVELRSPLGDRQAVIPHATYGGGIRDGWDFHAGYLWLGPSWSARAARYARDDSYNVMVWGYRARDPVLVPDDVCEFQSLSEESLTRLYCRTEGYRAINMDRSLFQQWQLQANNSDVSATQLNGMLGTAEGSFDRQQKRMFQPRRIPGV